MSDEVVKITQDDYTEPLTDEYIEQLFNGLIEPGMKTVQRMAYEIKKCRGMKDPEAA